MRNRRNSAGISKLGASLGNPTETTEIDIKSVNLKRNI